MRFRGKPIRRKIVALLLVPLVSLVSIWAFATYITSREAVDKLTAAKVMDRVDRPVGAIAHAVQLERRKTLVYLADPRRSDALSQLQSQRRATDRAVATIKDEAADSGLRDDLGPGSRKRLDALVEALSGLEETRDKVERNNFSRGGAFQAYNELVDPCHLFLTSLHGLHEADQERHGRALVGIMMAGEYLSREDALMAAALAAGEMTRGDQRAFTDRIAERKLTLSTNLQLLPPEHRETFQSYWDGTDGRTLSSYEDAIITAGPRATEGVVNSERWEEATSAVLDDIRRMGSEARQHHQGDVDPRAMSVLIRASVFGVLGLLAVLASLVISIRVGRGLIRDLSRLRKEASDSAGSRLPSVMRRLAAGEQVDIETEAPRLDYPADEAGEVGRALNTLQRAAVEAAVKQADMRRGVSEVFVNLARRNQVLLHRQLSLLDTMERRTEDTDELADLFRLDHLTTRMRRHAEGLVILSGAAPSRQWRKPVQLMDVVRAAVAEVEDYERIEVRRLSRLAVDGSAVADLTHLIAELLENATVFSPPHTAVQVLGERVSNGFTLEIHDRGLGMAADALLDANLRLAETPEFELSDTDRLGLFVVSRLALRQGVRVSLQPSPYGGTTAVVLIPGSILTETPGRDDEERRSLSRADTGADGGPGNAGRAVLAQLPLARLESGTEPGAMLNGPVELEAPLGEADRDPDQNGSGGPFGRRHTDSAPPADPPRQARPQAQSAPPQAPDGGPAPLPRRRPGAPVLVSDHGRPVGAGKRRPERSAGAPSEQGEEENRQRGPQRSPASPVSTPASGPVTSRPDTRDGPDTVGGLPRRVRQASLAPQLRNETDTGEIPSGTGSGPAPAAPDDRDADEVRSRMASLQRGWERGRRQNDDPSGDGAEETAPRTTPEGKGR
ncbi:nitrate- and nitrite sensing domain-containing protein [Streptomyces sp. N2-109]|uniref:histidine kinase n=1 Tax=Streptomyces gossypii TaxID=2883101 RepID=A0ABT2K302_9ACTN|nr:nitrate- and nitrite sensing domain-containing protein [Streptomyces gossypii]MCT2594547.1 nitrate- and nitrite sensing domain-containing protein [Streptomyces gossypii]